jgi:hypothetical protein
VKGAHLVRGELAHFQGLELGKQVRDEEKTKRKKRKEKK